MRIAVGVLAMLAACGSRTGVVLPDTGGAAGTSEDGGAGACGRTLSLAGAVTLDAPQPTSEPESAPVLAWTGSRLLVAWTRWTSGQYVYVVDPVQLGGGTPAALPATTFDPGNTSNPFNLRAVWDGAALALFWAQDDGSIVLQHAGPDGAPTDARPATIVAPTGAQTIPSAILPVSSGYLLTWFVQTASGWNTFAGPFTRQGVASAPSTLLYAGGVYDSGATLAPLGAGLFALWSTHTMDSPVAPVTTTIASLDPTTGAVQSTAAIDHGVDHDPSALAAEPRQQRLDAASWLPDGSTALVLSGSPGGAFSTRTTVDGATSAPLLAVDPCAGLVILTPHGQMTSTNPLPTGMTLQRVNDDGTLGAPVTLPVGSSYLESYAVLPVPGGLAVAWVEGGAGSPGRSMHLSMVRVQ